MKNKINDEAHNSNLENFMKKKHDELDLQKELRGDSFYAEVLEMIKLYYNDYERRTKEYWDMFYKAIFCIGILLIVPYFILTELSKYSILCLVFPCIAVAISTFSLYFLPFFHDKNLRYDLQLETLSTYLCKAYAVPSCPILPDSPKYMNYLKKFRVSKSTMWLFDVLLFLSMFEIGFLTLLLFAQ
jgi:hypothetical protein